MFHGSMVAIVTPMCQQKIDYAALEVLIEWHVSSGTSAIVVVGTTGESATLTQSEKETCIRFVVSKVRERIPVIAGTGHPSTELTILHTRAAMDLGAHAALVMTPAYIKPTQSGLMQHYDAIAKAVAIPIIIYNVPSRTACDIKPETLAQLRSCPNIVGIKEASGDVNRVAQIRSACENNIDIYSGEDALTKEMILNGAKGVISVTANVAPQLMAEMCQAALNNDDKLATKLDLRLSALHKALFLESNPIPVKWALSEMGLIKNELRMPLTPLSTQYHDEVLFALKKANVILPSLKQSTGS